MKYRPVATNYKDPVCGMLVSKLSAVTSCSYGKKIYYFCAEQCRDAFEGNPQKYVASQKVSKHNPNSMSD